MTHRTLVTLADLLRASGSRWAAGLTALFLALGLALVAAPPAQAHEERPATFPDGTGRVPAYAGLNNHRNRVVCTKGSRAKIRAMAPGALKKKNKALLRHCRFRSIQSAINTIKKRHTSIYVLPGVYRERHWATLRRSAYCSQLKSHSDRPLKATQYIGSLSEGLGSSKPKDPIALSYYDQRKCGHNLNLIALFGDRTPNDKSIRCNSKFCGTQLVGTGARTSDVVIDNRFSKLNGIRADRMGGAVFRNFTIQQAEFNSLYVMETDGFVIDHVVARANDEYGILAFASDHGVISHVDAYYNGDSGIYPGSGSDINANNPNFEPTRYAIEIRDSDSHHNTLGYSGTAGNSIHAYNNRFFDNATGIATDSVFPGHPGLPQDHARWDHNEIFSNNENWYTRYVDTGICNKPMRERGYINGTVCPVVPTPVGTGRLIAGGNFNSTDHNLIYDNWRYGTMQFWVPAPLRDEYDPAKLYDTSNGNHTFENTFGIAPGGAVAHNGLDNWWDDQGKGNCWENNTSSRGAATNNFTIAPASCAAGGSVWSPGLLAVKGSGFLPCSEYDRNDATLRHPPDCNWFNSPPKPTNSSGDPFPLLRAANRPAPTAGSLAGTGETGLALLLAVAAVGLLRRVRRGA